MRAISLKAYGRDILINIDVVVGAGRCPELPFGVPEVGTLQRMTGKRHWLIKQGEWRSGVYSGLSIYNFCLSATPNPDVYH